MSELLILVGVIVIVCLFLPHYWRHRQREQLRQNPPERVCFEVRLPHGTAESEEVSRNLYAQVKDLCTTSPEDRRHGAKTISLVFVARHPKGEATPELKAYVYCESAAARKLKKKIKTQFGGLAHIITPESDPLADLAAGVRKPEMISAD
jgi:hypothetical protein